MTEKPEIGATVQVTTVMKGEVYAHYQYRNSFDMKLKSGEMWSVWLDGPGNTFVEVIAPPVIELKPGDTLIGGAKSYSAIGNAFLNLPIGSVVTNGNHFFKKITERGWDDSSFLFPSSQLIEIVRIGPGTLDKSDE